MCAAEMRHPTILQRATHRRAPEPSVKCLVNAWLQPRRTNGRAIEGHLRLRKRASRRGGQWGMSPPGDTRKPPGGAAQNYVPAPPVRIEGVSAAGGLWG